MINLNYVLAHFIGDFLLQNDYLAVHKKKSTFVCLLHVCLYMMPFLLVEINWIQFALIAIQHFLQDRTSFVSWYCKTFKLFQNELRFKNLPWGHFVVDQIFHFIFLWLIIENLY